MDERDRLEELVERAEAAGHQHEGGRVLDEHDLAHEEVVEIDGDGVVLVRRLLLRQGDGEAHGRAAGFEGALVRRLHDAGAAAGNDGVARLRESTSQVLRQLEEGVVVSDPRGAVDSDSGRQAGERIEAFDELAHDAEHAPGFFLAQVVDYVFVLLVHLSHLGLSALSSAGAANTVARRWRYDHTRSRVEPGAVASINSGAAAHQLPPDDQSLYFRRPFIDSRAARLAEDPVDGAPLHEAVPAVKLE